MSLAANLNEYYERLAFDQEQGSSGAFLSGWQCDNPYLDEFIKAVHTRSLGIDRRRYLYFDEDDNLANGVLQLHFGLDGVAPQSVLFGAGSTPLIFTFATHLHKLGVKRVLYVPPVYFTLLNALERYAIRVEPVSLKQPFEQDFELNLPVETGCVLILSDPVWYTGTSIPHSVIAQIKQWQMDTQSYVFVDGSLQYLPWAGQRNEATSTLDPALTFRLVCPTKQLCSHGYRFAYILLPTDQYRSMAWTYANISGPATAESIAFAQEAISILPAGKVQRQLMSLVANRHRTLRTQGIISSAIEPSCGYFVFEKVLRRLPADHTEIDGRYFEQVNFPGYVKVNLLSPSIRLLLEAASALPSTDISSGVI